ncbi:Neprilysin-1 [Holothuria leucospilota]|uniref:Neprilysin-1 n=1 Tax=Holothuria leucospilota TaxID=206669 RepID=A0A9Q1BDX4_HOLLE|nr:Neprilysin-1 [Holothuria leucospilota]
MEMYSNQNCEEVVIEDGTFETRDGSLGAKMKWFWLRRTGLEKALLLLVFLLLLSLIAVIAVLVINTRQTYPDSEGAMEICMDDTCITAASEMISNMDLLADPCVDFYQYACGNWLRNNPIPENKNGINVDQKIAADVLASCNKILKEETHINDSNDILWKMKTFFKSCLNEELIEKDGAGPLLDFLAEFGGINTEEISVAEGQNATEEDMTTIFRKLYMASDAPIFATIRILNKAIWIYQPYCSIPLSRAELENEQDFINETLSYLYPNGSPDVISRMAAEFIDIHKTLVNCSSVNDNTDMGNLTTLQTLVPKIDWTSLIHSLVSESVLHYPVILHRVGYFRILGDLLDKTPPLLIKHYMMWRILRSLLPHTGGEIGDISRKYQGDTMTSNQDRDEFCMNISITYLEDALAGLFILRNVNSEDLHSQLSLFEQIRDSFRELVRHSEELDVSSREVILQMINKIDVEIAHPEYISNYSLLNAAFRSLQIGDHYVTNLIAARGQATVYELSGELSELTGIIRKSSSAAFYPHTVIVPLLKLLRPSLSVPKLRSLTFSGVGVSMGHEMSHSMDSKHSKEWVNLTTKGRDVFKDKMKCLLTALESSMEAEYGDKNLLYSNFEYEFWSDVSGLQISYQAFKNSPPGHLTLPYLNITLDQIFYLNFAQSMCGHYKKDQSLPRSNKYPPLKYRVIATLRISDSFSDAFDCPLGSPMNPQKEKCYIWH